MEAFGNCMRLNQNLGCYNIKFNFVSDYGVEYLCDVVAECKHVY